VKRRFRTADQNWVRERNLAIVLNYLWEARQPVSRTHLVEASGLSKATVGSLLAQLQSWGLVKESGVSDPRPGRPSVLMDINDEQGRLLGVEIGVGFVSVVTTDLKANVIWRRKVETQNDPSASGQARLLAQAEGLIEEAITETTRPGSRLYGMGVGVPGLVDHATGTLLLAPNLRWTNLPLREIWRRRFGVPVIVENEADAAALGERMLGVAQNRDNFVYLSAGVGLGGGLVVDGKLYGGAGGFAGEVGHMTLVPDGLECNCGNRGCWETLVGPAAIIRRLRQAAAEGDAAGLLALCGGDVDAIRMEQVLESAAQGEPAVLQALDEVGYYLGIGIANLVNAFNPSLVVLGGVLSLAGPYILPRAQEEVAKRALAAAHRDVTITLSAFRFDACVMGGAALVLREILNNPAAWQPQPEPTASGNEPLAPVGVL
jgi:glucokinase-like ROK family protein